MGQLPRVLGDAFCLTLINLSVIIYTLAQPTLEEHDGTEKHMQGISGAGRMFGGSRMHVVAAQFGEATPEMTTGFATDYAYDPNAFGRARQADERIVIMSAATNTKYDVQIRPVFTSEDESITDSVTMGTIVAVNGRKLQPLMVRPVWLENRDGRVYVRPEQ